MNGGDAAEALESTIRKIKGLVPPNVPSQSNEALGGDIAGRKDPARRCF